MDSQEIAKRIKEQFENTLEQSTFSVNVVLNNSHRYKNYLETEASLGFNFSPRNTALATCNLSSITPKLLKSFSDWKELGASIKKDSNALKLILSSELQFVKTKNANNEEKLIPVKKFTNEELANFAPSDFISKQTFNVVNVFDISQINWPRDKFPPRTKNTPFDKLKFSNVEELNTTLREILRYPTTNENTNVIDTLNDYITKEIDKSNITIPETTDVEKFKEATKEALLFQFATILKQRKPLDVEKIRNVINTEELLKVKHQFGKAIHNQLSTSINQYLSTKEKSTEEQEPVFNNWQVNGREVEEEEQEEKKVENTQFNDTEDFWKTFSLDDEEPKKEDENPKGMRM
ncbi:hypothetical protein [Ureaplasma diversum]|uniref:Uncharacterized protein n=1 Tax=Ureaplasma diversum NCTC 246 TaxID=1188241 RepID=A0A084EZ28_9BACT|nr:hypothetical protein [Ureaplasma diversum]KEZ23220.1 hypothetical protein UDIV_3840 [Ureaplasma diversum NCTC 246]